MLLIHEGFGAATDPIAHLASMGWTTSGSGSISTSSPGGRGAGSNGATWTNLALWPTTETTFTIGVAVYCPSNGATNQRLLNCGNASGFQWTVYLDAGNRRLRICTGDDAGTLATTSIGSFTYSTWFYVEVKITVGNSASYELKINGSTLLSGTGDTQGQGTSAVTNVGVTGMGIPVGYVSDIYICDGTGSIRNTFLGDVRSIALVPDSDEETGWTPSTGTDHYPLVDEATPNGDTDYVIAASSGLVDRYGYEDVNALSVVYGVDHRMMARKTDAGAASIQSNAFIDGSVYQGSPAALSTTYAWYRRLMVQNPDSSADWTPGEVNASTFGPESV